MAMNRRDRRATAAARGRQGNVKIAITYEELTAARNALVVISKVKGLSAANKMMIVRVRQALRPNFEAIDEVQRELIEKYIGIGHQRLKDQVLGRLTDDMDAEERKALEDAAAAIAEPTGVLPSEMEAYQTEYSKHLFEKCNVEVPQRIPAALVLNSPDVSADDAFLLAWLLEDDVTGKKADPAPKPVPAGA